MEDYYYNETELQAKIPIKWTFVKERFAALATKN